MMKFDENLRITRNKERHRFYKKTDNDWIEEIIDWLYTFYNHINTKKDFSNLDENKITKEIFLFLWETKQFDRHFIIVSQPENTSRKNKGFYDLQIFGRNWIDNNFLAIECKRLEEDNEKIKEYVYVEKKVKEKIKLDGGMYRFVQDDKYSPKLPYGAMLGYIQKGKIDIITKLIKDKIIETQAIKLKDKEQILNSNILNYPYTFQSKHTRNNGIDIELFHLFFDFQ